MRKSLNEWRQELAKALRNIYYTPTCDFCKEVLFMSLDEAEIVLFEPHEEEYVYWEGGFCDKCKKIGKHIVSSNPQKDIFKFKCPKCGHIISLTRKELDDLKCSYYGDNNIRFTLDEVETNRARKFKNEHNHNEDFKKEGKLAFTALGQQFTYEITPGGLGDCVVIKCNQCKDSEDITNIDNW